ncbi:hypothetical protein SAMN04490244_101341 [Tranquillimonas rosea]|uniref:Uncharacterized protein n=1 Tax=Tranquillimonas rosea TaxID=641238 RepID=A0A1H9PUU7_9RHOB|nr:hypothetical protein [Tranquillimonas rosea]SER51890.1 hypothetical protein SAMN04490244_101341 [Tranquillimonas rosea]
MGRRTGRAQTQIFGAGRARVAVREMPWGYVVRPCGPVRSRAKVAAVGLIVGLSGAVVNLLLSAGLVSAAVSAGLCVALSMPLLAILPRGRGPEIHFDVTRREMRLMRGGTGGRARLLRRIGFDGIESLYLQRVKRPHAPARLFARLAHDLRPVELAFACEEGLTLLHRRMSRDLRPEQPRDLVAPPAREVA